MHFGKKIRCCLSLFFVLSAALLFAQTPQHTAIDSLTQLLNQAQADTARLSILKKLALSSQRVDLQKHQEYVSQGYALALKLNNKKEIAHSLFLKALIAQKEGNIDKALSYVNSSMDITRKLNDTLALIKCFNVLGNIYRGKASFEKAVEYYSAGLALTQAIKDLDGIGVSYNGLGNVYVNKGDYAVALKNYLLSLSFFEKANSHEKVPVSMMNIGNLYLFQREYLKAIDYYEQSLANDIGPANKAGVYGNMGEVYVQLKQFDKANETLQKALQLSQLSDQKIVVANTLCSMGENYMSVEKWDKALEYFFKALKIGESLGDQKFISEVIHHISRAYKEKKNFNMSLFYAEKGLMMARQIGAKENIRNSYENLSEISQKTGNFEKSLEYYKLSVAIKDSMFNKEKMQSIAELSTRYETDKKKKEILLLTKDKQLKEKELNEQKTVRLSLTGGMILLLILSFTLYNRYRFKQKANQLLEHKNKEIEFKNMQITDSIDYAKTIQEAILPPDTIMQTYFPDSFILYKPKDIVSGDFYWVGEKEDKLICAIADCTGHGVPGAFMSLLGNNILENVIKKSSNTSPASILTILNEDILAALTKGQEKMAVKNGMDIAILTFDKKSNQLEYAGAQHPLYFIRDGVLSEIKADKISIGSYRNAPVEFTNHTLQFKKGDLIYLFSDGFPDQIGGANRKKFYYQPFKDLLLSIHQLSMQEQQKSLDKAIMNWKGELEQTDDILVMGIKCLTP